jgi:radical SAM protein with 4Fe4S-binding SPASM domain
VHCENRCGEKGANELSLDQMMQVAESLSALGCRTVDVTGGEPLMRADWDRICKKLSGLGMGLALITNGTLLTDSALDRAIDSGVGVVAVSIDGFKQVHDATRLRPRPGPSPWEEAVAGLKRSVERVTTKVITQVNQHNMASLPDLRSMLREMGVRHWQLQLAVPTGRLLDHGEPYVIRPEDLDELTAFIVEAVEDGKEPHIDAGDTIGYYTDRELSIRKRASGQGVWLGCQAGIRVVAITYDGMVRGCSAMPPDFDAGSLHEETLEEIWNDADRFAYSTRFDPLKLTGACSECRFAALCRAGCTSMAFWTTGTIYENPYCLLSQTEDR